MGLSEEIRRQLINTFKAEQSEYLQKISEGLLALEKNPPPEARQTLLEDIFREAHSLKGAARAVNMTTIESVGHGIEELLLQAKEGRLAFSSELFDLLYQALDSIELLIQRVDAGQSNAPAQVLTLLSRMEEIATAAADGIKEQAEITVPLAPVNEPNKKKEVGEISPSSSTPALSEIPAKPPSSQDETVRVSVNKLDALMAQFSELLGAKIRADQRLTEVRQLQQSIIEWQKELSPLRPHTNIIVGGNEQISENGYQKYCRQNVSTTDLTIHNIERLRSLHTQTNTLYRELSNDTLRLSLVIDELQEEIKRVRMLPLATITATFGRMVRDLAREQHKQINFTIEGSDTELDKRVLEQIKAPLIHLLRNAVDHGIDSPEERQQAGKPEEGQIILSALQQGNNVIITIRDDGMGLDIPAIRRSAVRRGLLSQAEAEKLSEAEASRLIFNSGLSTRELITDISGRGVGLDVVRRNVEELHGTLEVSTEPGQGTAFTQTLPLTLVSSRGLLVEIHNQTFALPFSTIERILRVDQNAIGSVEGKPALTYQNRPVALAWLADLLELPRQLNETDDLTLVIVTVAEKRLGLIVDDLIGEQEVVMKGFGKQLVKVGGIAGATVLGSGEVILVLHTADLIKLASRNQDRSLRSVITSDQKTDQRKTILVVDDSITTRTLEKNILEAAGYIVKLAKNGEEAWNILVSDGLPNLIVSDVNMPKLDGFGLTSRVRQDNRFVNIPMILVTSLDSPTDKARGIEVGADAYIVKSSFDQGSLLETIEQLA